MVKTRIWVNVAAIAAWVLALAGMVALAWGTRAPSWTSGAAAVASVIAVIGRQFSVKVLEQVLERLE